MFLDVLWMLLVALVTTPGLAVLVILRASLVPLLAPAQDAELVRPVVQN